MYCPSCGVEVAQALNYCKSCGANLNNQSAEALLPARPAGVVISAKLVILFLAIAFVGAIVPIGIVSNLWQLKEIGINSDQIAALLVAVAGTGLLTVALLVWLLMKLIGVAVFEPGRKEKKRLRTSELAAGSERTFRQDSGAGARGPAARRELSSGPESVRVRLESSGSAESVPSVTEHTTRSFDRSRVTE